MDPTAMNEHCPDAEGLIACLEDGAGDPELLRHVSSCASCSAQLALLRSDAALLDELAAARPAPAEPRLALPPEIPGYRILGELHRGGQGVVWRAEQQATRRTVALKLLLDGALASAEKRRRFEREIEVVARLRHPDIVTIYDSGATADGRHYYAMELVEGVALDAFVDGERGKPDWSLSRALTLFARICAAVHYAHQRGVIHRDLKPANILVDAAGAPHVLDFGLAKAIDGDAAADAVSQGASLSREGVFMGTLAYAAPEQLSGDPDAVDVRTDVHALGVILYEMLTGTRPFGAPRSTAELVRAIAEQEPEPPSRRAPEVDGELDTLVLTALAKEKERRYPSAGELERDVGRYLRREPLVAKGDSTWYVLRKALRRHRLPVAVAIVFVAVCVIAAVVSTTSWRASVRDAASQRIAAQRFGRINAVLQGMLERVHPDRAQGKEVTVREVLDDAARMVDAELGNEPEVAAPLHTTLGRTYLGLGLHDEAELHLAAALAGWRGIPGSHPIELATALCDLSEVHLEREQVATCERLLTEAEALVRPLAIRPDAKDEAVRCLAWILRDRARAASLQDDLKRAESVAQEGVALLRARTSGPNELLASYLTELGRNLQQRGNEDEARPYFRDALAMWKELGATDRLEIAESRESLGRMLRDTHDHNGAKREFDEALRIYQKLLGEKSPDAIRVETHLALSTSVQEGFGAAQPRYAALLEPVRALAEHRTIGAATALNNMGVLAAAGGDFTSAESFFREALATHRALGKESSSFATCADSLSWVIFQRGDVAAAEPIAREAWAMYQHLNLGDRPDVARTLNHLCWVVGAAGKQDEAEQFARDSLAMFERLRGGEHTDVADGLYTLGWCLFNGKKLELAAPLLEQALALRKKLLGDADADVARTMYSVAQLRVKQGRLPEAEALQRDCLDLRRELFGDEHPEIASSFLALGALLLKQGELDEAAGFLVDALAMRRRLFGSESSKLAEPRKAVQAALTACRKEGHTEAAARLEAALAAE